MAPENAPTLVLFGSVASFLGVTAAWIWHDATRRRASKPAFAALLAMMQGPLWLAFYLSDRPLCADERREGGFAWNMARHFAIAWSIANLPIAVIVLGLVTMSTRARSAPDAWSIVVGALLWCALPLVVAAGLGYALRRPASIEEGGAAPSRAGVSFVPMYSVATLVLWGAVFVGLSVFSPAQ